MPSPRREPRPNPANPGSGRPVLLVVVVLLVLVEAALLVGLAGAFGVELVRGASAPGPVVFLIVFLVAIAAVLALAVRGLWHGRRWARSPVLTWQLLLVTLALGWLGAEPSWWAAGILLVAVGIGVLLVLPSVVAATTHRPTELT